MSSSFYADPCGVVGSSLSAELRAFQLVEDMRRYEEIWRYEDMRRYEEVRALAEGAFAGVRQQIAAVNSALPDSLYLSEAAHLAIGLAEQDHIKQLLASIVGEREAEHRSLFQDRLSELQNPYANPQLHQIGSQLASYKESADLWAAGGQWRPHLHSMLAGLDDQRTALINEHMDSWRHLPGYAEAFSTLASVSDAIVTSRASFESYSRLVGDIGALAYSSEFAHSPAARLNAYRDVGFDTALLKPSQAALAAMLSINGYADPLLLRRQDGLIISRPRQRMSEKLKALKPTRFERKGYNESYALERWLRHFIDEEMSNFYGYDWHKTRAPKKLRGKIEKQKINPDEVSGVILLDDADIPHYLEIILDDDHWENVFAPIFGCRLETQNWLTLFKSLRVSIAHHKGFSKHDFLQLRSCVSWFTIKVDGDPEFDDE